MNLPIYYFHIQRAMRHSLMLWPLVFIFLSACVSRQTSNSTPLPSLVTEAPSALAYVSLTAVTNSSPPARDMAELAAQYMGVHARRVAQTTPIDQNVGDILPFWFKNLDTNENEQIEATLVYRSEALNMWVQLGEKVNQSKIEMAAVFIESQILPTNRAFFGHEWQPGVDGDTRINILHLKKIGGIGAAYFWSGDEYVSAVNPYSNQRELLYISLKDAAIGSDTYYSAVAHELQHLIQWHTDTNEDAWLNEGMGELAAHVNGFDQATADRAKDYVAHTDIQLNTLSQDRDVVAAHYGASTLFSIYFMDRFGEEATRALVSHPENGINGFAQILDELDGGISFDDLFADWLAINYLAGEGRGEGIYQYHSLARSSTPMPAIKPEKIRRLPTSGNGTVNQYGADYLQLSSDEPVTVIFTGTQQVNLVDAEPHSGHTFWVTHPADESDMSLIHEFDLTGLVSASLQFWTWYEIEAGWDYGYVAISADNGLTWVLLETESSTTENPEGNSLGPGYTGISGGGRSPTWIQETADLTPYAGQPVSIRFQYLTDGAVHEGGFIIDDIAIPELAYFDDVESDDGGWQANGFARTGHVLPQHFIVQQILLSDDDVQVNRLQLDENQRGWWLFPMDNRHNTAILIISGSTPVTRHAAAYAYEMYR